MKYRIIRTDHNNYRVLIYLDHALFDIFTFEGDSVKTAMYLSGVGYSFSANGMPLTPYDNESELMFAKLHIDSVHMMTGYIQNMMNNN